MEDVTKDKDNIILLVIIAGLVGWNIFTTNTIKTDVKGYEKKIESIQTKIDSSQVVNKKIDTKIGEVKENVTTITNQIQHIDKNIKVLATKDGFTITAKEDIRENIAQKAAGNNWLILSMNLEESSLEQVFQRLTK